MSRDSSADLSELERELEQELELETDERELGRELEMEGAPEERETDERELELEMEGAPEERETDERELEQKIEDFTNRFYELSTRRYESEYEMEQGLDRLMNEMEQEFFFGALKRAIGSIGRRVGGIVKKARGLFGRLPITQIVRGVTQLARGNLRGLLGTLARTGIGALANVIPGGQIALPALQALGFRLETSEAPQESRPAWRNFVSLADEAYNHLLRNVNENMVVDPNDPVARENNIRDQTMLAQEAYLTALNRVRSRTTGVGGYLGGNRRRRYRIRVSPGDLVNLRIIGNR